LNPKKPTTLRDLALDHLADIAAEFLKADPGLSREQSVAKAAQTREGLEARRLYNMKGAELPAAEAVQAIVTRAVAKAAGPDRATLAAYKRWRADLDAKGGVAKEGGGSGPRGGRIEDPKISGPARPADTLPSPADVILAMIHRQALERAPSGTSQEAATAAFLGTKEGATLHAEWNAARLIQGN
jgi:hypothetical protein